MGRKRKKITIKKVTIEDAGAKGKSITRLENGLVLFVEGFIYQELKCKNTRR